MTLIERYILASVITAKYIDDDTTYEEWIEEYRLHRKRIADVLENKSTEKVYNDDLYDEWMFFKKEETE